MDDISDIPFFDDSGDDVPLNGAVRSVSPAPSSPASSLLASADFLNLFMAKTRIVRHIGDDSDEVCCELTLANGRQILCRLSDPRLLDHANAIAKHYSHGDLSCFLGQRDFPRLQDFCRSLKSDDLPLRPVHKRLAWCPDERAIWLDLSRPDSLCVRICRTHWSLEQPLHPIFLNSRSQCPLPEPEQSDDGYAALCRMLPPMPETDIKLLTGAMLGMMIPSNFNPSFSYPILVITGDPGAGKSTLAKLIKILIDNEITATTTRPSKVEDLWVQARYSHVLSYDNMRTVWDGLSDAMCALTTNAAQIRRSLYTNSDLNILRGHCAILLNGINPALAQQDLLDRAITITLQRFKVFDPDAARSEAELPLVLGYLCDLMVRALANYAATPLSHSVRLSLVAKIATAAEPFGCDDPFIDLLRKNQQSALVATKEHDPLVDAIYDLMGGCQQWRGTYKELLSALSLLTDLSITNSPVWPRTAHKLSAFCRDNTRLLRELNIDLTPGPKRNNGRIVTLSRLAGFVYSKGNS